MSAPAMWVTRCYGAVAATESLSINVARDKYVILEPRGPQVCLSRPV